MVAAADSSSVYHEQADARQDGSRHENSPRLFTSCLPMNIFRTHLSDTDFNGIDSQTNDIDLRPIYRRKIRLS